MRMIWLGKKNTNTEQKASPAGRGGGGGGKAGGDRSGS